MRFRALKVLAKGWRRNERAIAAVRSALRDPDTVNRLVAVEALLRMEAMDDETIGALLRALKEDESPSVRAKVAQVLGIMRRASPNVIEGLREAALRDGENEVRYQALEALATLGEEIPLEALGDANEEMREKVVTLLGHARDNRPEAHKALRQIALRDEDALIRASAIWALGAIGSSTSETIQALLEALRDKEAKVRAEAARVLGLVGLGKEEVSVALRGCLHDPAAEVRGHAILGLHIVSPGLAVHVFTTTKSAGSGGVCFTLGKMWSCSACTIVVTRFIFLSASSGGRGIPSLL